MDESSGSEQKFEELSKAIAEAVMNSKKVKKVMEDIQKKEKICPQSFMVLVLKMQVLADSLDLDLEEPAVEKRRGKRSRKKSYREQVQYIDGRKLSKNEIDFENFFSERFDADQWLKKNGLEF